MEEISWIYDSIYISTKRMSEHYPDIGITVCFIASLMVRVVI